MRMRVVSVARRASAAASLAKRAPVDLVGYAWSSSGPAVHGESIETTPYPRDTAVSAGAAQARLFGYGTGLIMQDVSRPGFLGDGDLPRLWCAFRDAP
jgi:hypothetical protein